MFTDLSKYLVIILSLLILFSCNAPRNNPLDPENSNNSISSIEGYIKTVDVPQIPLNNTSVFWSNDGIITQTNEDGYFRIENIERVDGWLFIEKEGYSKDSILINFNNQKKITKTIFLNSIPKIIDLKFYSITINKFPDQQKYSLEAKIKISDEENDIDSVFIENTELMTNKKLLYNASTKYYENSITLEDLNVTSIDEVIGKIFSVNVVDSDSNKFIVDESNIKRIIKEEVESVSPLGKDTVFTGNPTLVWDRFKPGFKFRQLLEIYTSELPNVLVWQKEIISDERQFTTAANLPSGDYYWVIWAIDEFENRTQSKPSSFIIK